MEHYALSRDKGHVLVICSSWEQGQQSLKHSLSELSLPEGGEELLVPLDRYELRNAGYAGERILVLGTENLSYGVNENSAVYEYDWQQGALRKLFAPDCALENSVGSDCRLGGGRSLVFTEDGFVSIVTERNSSKLVRFELDGKRTELTKDEGSVDCMDLQKGALLYVAMRDGKLQELYQLTEQGETCLTDFNGKVLEEKYVAEPRFLSFTNRDGVEIDGFVLEPVDYDPQKRYPAILDIHGGPKTVYGNCFYHEMQYWANEEYFVFFCNPRGGDGRGDAFADIRGRYGKEDYQDIMEFTDQVLKAYPQIDPARLGVTGGSYGGFMTNWIIGNTDRFAAAASQRSIANWISMEGTSDIGPFFGEDQSGGNAWRNPETAWECSPLKYAEHCKTPTLFIHSDEDYRCWMVGLPLLDGGGLPDVLRPEASRRGKQDLPLPWRKPRALQIGKAQKPDPQAPGDHGVDGKVSINDRGDPEDPGPIVWKGKGGLPPQGGLAAPLRHHAECPEHGPAGGGSAAGALWPLSGSEKPG